MMAIAIAISRRSTGGGFSQPAMNAKPVKNTSCQANGLKNQTRSDHGSAGRSTCPVVAASHSAATAAIATSGDTRASPTTTGIISRMTRYIGRMSK